MLFKGSLVFIWLVLVPFCTGSLLLTRFAKKQPDVCSCVTCGYLFLFAVCELCFVPMILLRLPFHTAACVVAGVLGISTLLSVLRAGRSYPGILKNGLHSLTRQPVTLYAALVLILIQALIYVFFMSTDLDDSFYVAAATTALENDTMYVNDPYTGMVLDALPSRYVLSPMPMLTAFLAKFTGFHAAVVAHTILPFFLIGLAYMVYDLMGCFFFPERKDTVGVFLILLSVIHISSYYSVYTQGTFLLIRIWQGKAVLAGILLPHLFFLCCKMQDASRERADWILMLLTVLSCCMVSSMGIALAPVMLGIFAVLDGLLHRNWRCFFSTLLCCVPCAVLALLYLCYF